MQEKIDRKIRETTAVAGYNETRGHAIAGSDRPGQRPIRRFNLPTSTIVDQGRDRAGQHRTIQKKLERIIIPTLEFQEATIREAVEFLKKKSIDLDTTEPGGIAA